jgi:hypothetical protein
MARRGGASRFRFRVLPSVLLTAAILLLPALLYAWGRQADAFTVERVTVAGGRRIPPKQALRILRKEFLGRNLFTVTTADVRSTLDKLCYLASVSIDRDFPTTLRVRLVEHQPLAYVLANGRWFVVADSGHVICAVAGDGEAAATAAAATASAEPTSEPSPEVNATDAAVDDTATDPSPSAGAATASTAAPADGVSTAVAADASSDVVTDTAAVAAALQKGPTAMKPKLPRMATGTTPHVGRPITDEKVRLGLRVLAGLPSSLLARVEVVSIGSDGQASLDLEDGPRVELGGEERLVAKVLALRAVLTAYRRAGTAPTFIDVSAPDRPLGRPYLSS